jgi:Rieske Fe-S protein
VVTRNQLTIGGQRARSRLSRGSPRGERAAAQDLQGDAENPIAEENESMSSERGRDGSPASQGPGRDLNQVPRRGFLAVSVGGSAAALAVTSAYPVARYLEPPRDGIGGPTLVGKLDDFPVGSVRIVVVNEQPVFVLRSSAEVRAFSALCTHLQCVVQYSPEQRRFECPCHGGIYALDGRNLAGPPPRPLEELDVTIAEGNILVGAG